MKGLSKTYPLWISKARKFSTMDNKKENRIKILRNYLGLTQQEFAQKLGYDRQNVNVTVSRWENGQRNPTKLYSKMAKEFNVSLDWLISGEGQMFSNQDVLSPNNNYIQIGFYNNYTELSDVNFSANLLNSLANEQIIDYPKRFSCIRVNGDSMSPTIINGDLALLDLSCTIPEIDNIFAINVNNAILIKRIGKISSHLVTLQSDNSTFHSLEINLADDFVNILGKVVWIGRKLKN